MNQMLDQENLHLTINLMKPKVTKKAWWWNFLQAKGMSQDL